MRSQIINNMPRAALGLALSAFAATAASAQTRLSLPAGTVIIVETTSTLQSSSAQVGQTFDTRVVDAIGLDNYTVIPTGTHVRGSITFVQPANRQQSGVIEVAFNRLTLPDGTVYPIVGRLTSTDANERAQIDQNPNSRVVLVGGRGGIGATIAGAGSTNSPVSSILSALGGLLSQAQDVSVPAGTQLAVQLDQAAAFRSGRRLGVGDPSTIYTAPNLVSAAQQALTDQNYYHGSITGQIDYATQRALFDYQTAKGLRPTGNLDGRTAASLGILTTTGDTPALGGGAYANMLSATDATRLRRDAQNLAAQERATLSIAGNNVYSRRASSQADVDLWFALSAFADNVTLYEQLTRGNSRDASLASTGLLNAARRVDQALLNARPTSAVQNSWASLRQRLMNLDPTYR